MPDGFLILNKPTGISSAGLLNRAKRFLPRGTKIGHAGTLDPLATGVLVAMVGKATKQCERVMGQAKQYEAILRLGATSATDDAEGPIVERDRSALELPPVERIRSALAGFVGSIDQLPPAFSAIKVDGRRACDRVRDGQTVELKSRLVRIDRIDLLQYDFPTLTLRVDCGRGTYIRSLARDVGAALGTGGYLAALCRTRVGNFTIERAVTLETLGERGLDACLLPLAFADDAS